MYARASKVPYKQTIEWQVIWDYTTFMWRHRNVDEVRYCVIVNRITSKHICALLTGIGPIMCIPGSSGRGAMKINVCIQWPCQWFHLWDVSAHESLGMEGVGLNPGWKLPYELLQKIPVVFWMIFTSQRPTCLQIFKLGKQAKKITSISQWWYCPLTYISVTKPKWVNQALHAHTVKVYW